MLLIKVLLIVVWFIAGLLLFAKDVVVDFPILRSSFVALGLVEGKVKTIKVEKSKPAKKVVVSKPAPKPIVEAKEEAVEEENALENVQIFKKKIKARTTWYASLTESEKAEFRSYFVDEVETHLVKELKYVLNGNNDSFFEKVFNYIYTYRKLISASLLQKLTDELLFFAENDPEVQTIVYEAATRVAYYRRKDKSMLDYAEKLARLDVALHQGALNSKNKYVYSFTRLAIILERKGEIQNALAVVSDALARKLNDRTKTGYQGRKARLEKRLAK